jgi:Domain of unknown function (DUF397)
VNDAQTSGWRKSRRSNDSANCVEVGAVPDRRVVGVRDSKQEGRGPVLEFATPAWEAFVTAIRDGKASL